MSCIHDAAEVALGVKRTCERSVAWWNKPGVRAAFDAMQRAHRAWQAVRVADRDVLYHRFIEARRHWQQVVADAKRQAWRELCATLQPSVRAKVMWSVLRRTRPSTFSSLSSFPHPSTGELPSSLGASLDHLASAFVQSGCPPQPLPVACAARDGCIAV